MEQKIILRLAAGMELPDSIHGNLKKILKNFEVEYYPIQPDLKRSYQRRINSIEKAFLFILEAIPNLVDKKTALHHYASWCRSFCSLPAGDVTPIETYQHILEKYTNLLLNALVDHYPYRDQKDDKIQIAIDLLNKAEQYVIMKTGRADMATLLPIKRHHSTAFLLRWEQQLPPYSEITLQEFKIIKETPLLKVPNWFHHLPSVWQLYLYSCMPDERLVAQSNLDWMSQIVKDLTDFYAQWSKVKHLRGPNLDNDLRTIEKLRQSAWFLGLNKEQQQLLTFFCESGHDSLTIDASLHEFNQRIEEWMERETDEPGASGSYVETLKQLRKIPYWFLVLEDYEKHFLKVALDSSSRLEDCISFAPSRLRRLPLVANFCQTNVFLLQEGDKIKAFPPRLRSSHLASRDTKKLPIQISSLHAQRNMTRIASFVENKEQTLLIQTLISPLEWLKGHTPDYYLDQQRRKALATFEKGDAQSILSTNHPLNMVRYFHYTQASEPACLAIIHFAEVVLLIRQLPEIPFSWDLTRIKTNLSRAYQICQGTLHPLETTLDDSDDDEEGFLEQCVSVFGRHEDALVRTNGWQAILANQLNLRKNATLNGLSEQFQQNLDDIQSLVTNYSAILNSAYGTATIFDYYGRELFLSSLESLIINYAHGISYGSCVSGKDRKEIVETHTIAMQIYREIKGQWPSMSDVGPNRTEFVDRVVDLVVSRHGHEHAGQNANGSDGIKTPANYWPKDIAAAICKKEGKDALTHSDILASNNEIDRIVEFGKGLNPGFSHCLISVLGLSKENRETILGLLAILCSESSFLHSKTWGLSLFSSLPWFGSSKTPKIPTGFEIIKAKLDSSSNNEDVFLVHKLAEIYFDIAHRPKESPYRAQEIQQVYTILLDLCKNPQSAETQIQSLKKIKEKVFESNQSDSKERDSHHKYYV